MAVGDSNAQPGPEARLAAIFAEAEAKLGMRFKIDTGGMQCANPSWFVVTRVS